jgi:hypothetical protein
MGKTGQALNPSSPEGFMGNGQSCFKIASEPFHLIRRWPARAGIKKGTPPPPTKINVPELGLSNARPAQVYGVAWSLFDISTFLFVLLVLVHSTCKIKHKEFLTLLRFCALKNLQNKNDEGMWALNFVSTLSAQRRRNHFSREWGGGVVYSTKKRNFEWNSQRDMGCRLNSGYLNMWIRYVPCLVLTRTCT